MKALKKLFASAVVGTAMVAAPAMATTNPAIDPDGSGGAEFNLVSLDWNVGNALSVGGVDAVATGVGSKFTTYYQASLSLFNTVGPGIALPVGYEWTIVVGVDEVVTSVSGSQATFALDPGATINFLKIYYDPTPDANALAGTGYEGGDSVMILSATITALNSDFRATGGPGLLDQSGGDNYAGQQTIFGQGSTTATAKVDSFDSAFFTDLVLSSTVINLTFANTQQILPFQQVDPSAQFADGSGGFIIPNLGAVNGASGPDIQFQIDLNQSFDVRIIPEPLSAATGLMGLSALGLALRRRRA